MTMNIKNLIEKYYKGETSSEEEKILRDVFSSNETNTDDLYSYLIFKTFSEEKKEPVPSSIKTLPKMTNSQHKSILNHKKWMYAITGTAACLAIIFGTFFYQNKQKNSAYVIINGVRINDENLAIQYISNSFKKEDSIMNIALTQLEKMEKVESKLNNIENMLSDSIKYVTQKIKSHEKNHLFINRMFSSFTSSACARGIFRKFL